MQLKSACFIPLLAIVFTACAGCSHESNSVVITGPRVEVLTPVASGIITNVSGGDHMSYGLYSLVGPPGYGDEDFLLVLRNIGAKFIDLEAVTIHNFRLQDSKGREARLVLHSLPRSVGAEEATSLQICAIDFSNASFPLVLTFKANLGVPVYLCITNIVSIGKK